jgi:hypothetical protein
VAASGWTAVEWDGILVLVEDEDDDIESKEESNVESCEEGTETNGT